MDRQPHRSETDGHTVIKTDRQSESKTDGYTESETGGKMTHLERRIFHHEAHLSLFGKQNAIPPIPHPSSAP